MHRTALAATTAALTALVLVGCGDPETAVTRPASPATSSSTTPEEVATPSDTPAAPAAWTTEVPDAFPLAAGLPATNGDDGTPVEVTDRPTWTSVELCGEVVWSAGEPVARRDLAGASYTGEAEDSRSRVLALYDDDRAAQSALDALVDAYVACPAAEESGTEQVYELVQAEHGSVTVTHRYRTDGRFDTGLEVIEMAVVGNALLLSSYYGEGGGSDVTIDSAIQLARDWSRPVVAAMEVFDPDAPGAPGPSGEQPAADVPLAAGWTDLRPEEGQPGIEFPTDTPQPQLSAWGCGADAPLPAEVEQLHATYGNVEDYRSRTLLTFPDADAAVAHVADLRRVHDDCPTLSDQGFTYPLVVTDTAVGGQSFGVVRFAEADGVPAVGVVALHVVRLGRAVLLDTAANEGGAGPETREVQARAQLDRLTKASADVVAAMCAFTEAGC
jgi:hypothetical protein